jgi:hypothetical protein
LGSSVAVPASSLERQEVVGGHDVYLMADNDIFNSTVITTNATVCSSLPEASADPISDDEATILSQESGGFLVGVCVNANPSEHSMNGVTD